MNLRDFFKSIAVLAVSPWNSLQSVWSKKQNRIVEVFPEHAQYTGLVVQFNNEPFSFFKVIREYSCYEPYKDIHGETLYLNNDFRNKWWCEPLGGGQQFLGIIQSRYELRFDKEYPWRFFKEV